MKKNDYAEDAWQLKAACRGPQSTAFFPPPLSVETKEQKEDRELQAKAVCATCSVRKPCLDYALRIREPHGIWGGLSESERKRLVSRRAG